MSKLFAALSIVALAACASSQPMPDAAAASETPAAEAPADAPAEMPADAPAEGEAAPQE